MAQATVKTVQFVDPRIEPQPDPVYDYVIGPTQNQYYKIQASGKSNSSLTFNNLTTLGIDRAYLDTFELELTCKITFKNNKVAGDTDAVKNKMIPAPDEWTFDSFPFNKCCDEARVNINGGGFFSQPLCYVRAKERYMNQEALARCYENVCPIHKPNTQTESGRDYSEHDTVSVAAATAMVTPGNSLSVPTRLPVGMSGFMQSSEGMLGGFNNSILNSNNGTFNFTEYKQTGTNKDQTEVLVTWREPIFASPFSSRYDATYGRPLYNITSMDISFTMQSLNNMIRLVNFRDAAHYVTSYTIDIQDAYLCYQVMTIPNNLVKPNTTLVPYRRFVPYITNAPSSYAGRVDSVSIETGVYTLNEIPTAIWIFCQPDKATIQNSVGDSSGADGDNVNYRGNWDSNKLFAYIKSINISMANTTQILSTATPYDLYRIAKANGCEDSFWSWGGFKTIKPGAYTFTAAAPNAISEYMYDGAGSVLRLIPGVDLIVPDQPLIPGANANNMVFKAQGTFAIPPHPASQNNYALWMLFEYVGVASISPGQCEISMNPLGSGEIMAASPVMSATSISTEGVVDNSGVWGKVLKNASIANQSKLVDRMTQRFNTPNAASKRPRVGEVKEESGGAVLGFGDWMR